MSVLLTTVFGAGQAVVLVAILGQGERTDAFFAAYAVYLPLVLWAAALRASVVPLVLVPGDVSDDHRRAHASVVVSRVLGIGALASIALLAAAPLLAAGLGHGMTADGRRLLLECIPLLVLAGFLHFGAGALSAVLSATHRFVFSAFAYTAGSGIALGASALFVLWLGAIGTAIGVLVGATCIALAHAEYARRLGVRVRVSPVDAIRQGGRGLLLKVAAGGALLAAQQADLAITLSRLSSARGAITSFTYAYMLINLIANLSFSPLSLALMPGLVRDATATGIAAARAQLVRVASVASYLLLPSVIAAAAFAEPVISAVVSGLLNPTGVDRLVTMIRVLAIVAVPTGFFFVSGNALHALQRWSRVMWLAAASVAIHAAIVLPLGGLGPDAITWAHAGSMLIIAALLVRATMGSEAWRVLGSALGRMAPAAAMALVFVVARLAVGHRPSVALAAGALVLASASYVLLLLTFRPEVRARLRWLPVGRLR